MLGGGWARGLGRSSELREKSQSLLQSPQPCPTPPHLCDLHSYFLPTPSTRPPLHLKQYKQSKIELITSLPLANQNPKGLIKIPPVAKPWVVSDFISEISERDWRMQKQPTCLNMN